MIFKIYSVYDSVAEEYMPVFQTRNDGTALRAFKNDMENKPKGVNVADYDLIRVAEFNNETGKVTACVEPISVLKSLDFEKMEQ